MTATASTLEVSAAPPRRILLVDDEENVLRALRRLLSREANCEIHTAKNGASALELCRELSPQVVISDFRMPGMNGVELLTEIRSLNPRTQRIMLTGQADQYAIEDAISRSQIFRFVFKPWDDHHLAMTVKSAFEQYDVLAENERLSLLSAQQNEALRALNADLESRVEARTKALARAKREWEASFDSIDFPLAIVSPELRVHRANVAYARVAKRKVQEIAEHPVCHEYLFGTKTPCVGCPARRAREIGGPATGEVKHQGRTIMVSAYPIPDEVQVVCTYRDVTDEREMNRRLTQTEKMVAVGQLAGGVAHEINNPLGGILAFAQLMKREAGRSESDREGLDVIEESAIRCKKIVASLLNFSRRTPAEDRTPTDLSRAVEDATILFRAQVKSAPKVKLESELAKDLPQVMADSVKLGQVVLNLMQNALYALPDKAGTIRVETCRVGDDCLVRVTDTGTGIAPEHVAHLFEPTFTTKPPGEGTGLGLAIAYRIVEDHGGRFDVSSELGKGSTFTVRLPIAKSPTRNP
jgi:two-component system, NtrC family, sensor kinase